MHVFGEAANLLKNIPVTDKKYDHAWEKLKKRFSTKHFRQNINTLEKKVYHTTKTTTSKKTCSYCNNGHYLHKCQKFASLSYNEKKDFIARNQLCYNCLVPYHGIKQCRHSARCHSCGKKHHSLIHPPPEYINEINTAYTSSHRRETSNFDNHIQST